MNQKLKTALIVAAVIAALAVIYLIASSIMEKQSAATYQVPKESAPAADAPMPPDHPMIPDDAAGEKNSVTYDLPAGWKEEKASGMRVASFSIESDAGKGDCSIIILNGDGGGISANVNLWRQQIGLTEADEKTIMAQMTNHHGRLGIIHSFKIINNQDPKAALLTGIIQLKGQTLFVKLKAPLAVINNNEKKFIEFCQSLNLQVAPNVTASADTCCPVPAGN